MVDVLFDPETCLFWDRHVASGEQVRIKTPACFIPLLEDVPVPTADAMRAIEAVLLNPACFFGEVPFPSVAYDEECYDPKTWWRGPTWMPVAYLMLQVLEKRGFASEAAQGRERLYRMLLKDGNLRELFNSKTGEGMGARQQGWTAAICLRLHEELRPN